jgi:ribosome biogenesis GTPase / thiamine phosphate phosphatase
VSRTRQTLNGKQPVVDNPSVTELASFGWDEKLAAAFEPFATDGLVPARVAIQHRGAYDVLTAEGEERAQISGRMRHAATSPAELPVVGDWVALERPAEGPATIQAVLERRTKFSRRAAQDPTGDVVAREQVVAANVDVVFVVASLADDLDPRLLERYLTLAWESGAHPVILLTKADLEPDADSIAAELSAIGRQVPIHVVSARTALGLDAVRSHLGVGLTGALVGPSGVGKSTLVNALVGEELLATGGLRADGSGRHTTTRRQLVLLEDGGLLVDNPGMREVHLWLADEGLDDAFPDVAELETRCRFRDCRHESEPGCAVQEALGDGRLPAERWRSYRDLQQELAELEERLADRERSRSRPRPPGR